MRWRCRSKWQPPRVDERRHARVHAAWANCKRCRLRRWLQKHTQVAAAAMQRPWVSVACGALLMAEASSWFQRKAARSLSAHAAAHLESRCLWLSIRAAAFPGRFVANAGINTGEAAAASLPSGLRQGGTRASVARFS